MENKIKQFLKSTGILLAVLVALWSCNDQNDLGIGILPQEDLISVYNMVVNEGIQGYTYLEDSIVTSTANSNLLGSLHEPTFGKTTVDFATQFRLTSFPDFGTNPVVDSVVLYFFYTTIYGDHTSPQRLKVYELSGSLDPDFEYNQHVDLKSMSYDKVLADFEYIPATKLDTVDNDTTYLMAIPLDKSIGEKIVYADSLDLINNDVFLELFKGLYIESEAVSEDGSGALITLQAAATSSFQGSAMVVYYNNDENDVEEPDTLSRPFIITQYSARVSGIEHDYSGTPFENDLDKEEIEKEHIYVQPTGGLKSKIIIPSLGDWKDSINFAINKAELIFKIDEEISDIENFAPPSSLIFTFIDTDGEERIPVDYYFSPDYYGGILDTSDYTYSFNITQHMQRIINVRDPEDEDYVGNQGFFLTTGQRSDFANRVVLEGTKENGVELVITYSKFYQ